MAKKLSVKADSGHLLRLVLLFVLSVFSFITTFTGLKIYSPETTNMQSLAFLVAIVLMIQSGLIYSMMRFFKSYSFGMKTTWLATYVLLMGISVFCSYAYWYQFIASESHGFSAFSVQLEKAKDKASKLGAVFEAITTATTKLSNYSTKTSGIEKSQGGTCGISNPGYGNRTRFRLFEAKAFKDLAKETAELDQILNNHLNILQGLQYNAQTSEAVKQVEQRFNAEVQDINRLMSGSRLGDIKETLVRHKAERSSFSFYFEGKNRVVSCPDATIERKARLLIDEIDQLKPLPAVTLFNPNNQKKVMERALFVFSHLPAYVLNQQATKQSTDMIEQNDVMPILIAVLIDSAILFVGFLDGQAGRRRAFLSKNFKGAFFSVNDFIKISQVFKFNDLRTSLSLHHYQINHHKHLYIIPINFAGDDNESSELFALFSSLENHRRLEAPLQNVPFRLFPESLRQRFTDHYGNACEQLFFKVYPLNDNQFKEISMSLDSFYLQLQEA